MPAWLLWKRITETSKRNREEAETEQKWRVLELLIQARSLSFSLQANTEPPPSWEDLERQRKQKKPQKGKVDKAYKAFKQMLERHQEGIGSAYAFEEYMGLATPDGKGHLFEKPPEANVQTAKQITQEERAKRRQEVAGIKERLTVKLDRFTELHGNKSFDELATPAPPQQ